MGSRCKISGKSKVLGSSKSVRNDVSEYSLFENLNNRGMAVDPTTESKDLGVGTTVGIDRMHKVIKRIV